MDALFTKSLSSNANTIINIDFFKLAKKNFNSTSFTDKTKEPTVQFELLSEDSKTSKNEPSLHFTNFIGKKTDQNNIANVIKLFDDLTSLQSKQLTAVNLMDRVTKIFELYNYQEPNEQLETNVAKADLKDGLGNQQGVRIYFTFEHEVKEKEWLIHTKIILIDLYHLVIPSRHGKLTADKAKTINYDINRHNNECLSNQLLVHKA